MLRLCLIMLPLLVSGAFAEASACTILPSQFKPGSAEAIAEERAMKTSVAEWIADYELVFVGRFVGERQPDIAETTAALRGTFGSSELGDFPHLPAARSWYEPVRTLKGSADFPTTNLFVGEYGSSCGWRQTHIEKGDEVIVYANRVNGFWLGHDRTVDVLPYVEEQLRQR